MDWWWRTIFCAAIVWLDSVLAWNFGLINATQEDVTLVHVSVYYLRAYLSIKSDDPGWKIPTLVESMWPETVFGAPVQSYSGKRFHHLSNGPSNSCRKLVQSFRTAVDPRGNLFILDNGSEESKCGPKLIVMSFFHQELQRKHLSSYRANSFTDLILDTKFTGIRYNATRAYLSVRNRDYILYYSLVHNEVRKLRIQPSHVDVFSKAPPISITAMGMTGLGGGDVAILYDNLEKAVYQVNLRVGRSQGHLYAIQLGNLLGNTRSLIVDPIGQLYYSSDRDGALFRWNIKTKLTAENHEVLHFQTSTAAQVLYAASGAIFIINEKPIDEYELIHSQRVLDHYSLEHTEVQCAFCD